MKTAANHSGCGKLWQGRFYVLVAATLIIAQPARGFHMYGRQAKAGFKVSNQRSRVGSAIDDSQPIQTHPMGA